MLMAMTDNRNRTASEVRSVFSRCGGNLGETGSVAWNFESKAVVAVEECSADKAEEVALDAIDVGAEDFKVEDGGIEITGPPAALERSRKPCGRTGSSPPTRR